MTLAAVGDTPYNILLFLHILSAMVAFAPAFVHSVLPRQMANERGARNQMVRHMSRNGRMIYSPALILTGVLGFGLAGMSDDVFKMSQGWLVAAIIVWIAVLGVLHAVLIPAERAVGSGDDTALTRADLGGAAATVLMLIALYLMVFKPGL